MIQFDEHIFQMGWFNHQLVMIEVLNPEKKIGKQIPRLESTQKKDQCMVYHLHLVYFH